MMITFRFQQRFVPLVREGMKLQCYRRHETPRLRAGERFSTRSETSFTPITANLVCTAVMPIHIAFLGDLIDTIRLRGVPQGFDLERERFAVQEGFIDIDDMSAWHAEQYGTAPFDGFLYEWAMPRHEREIAA
ncbi:MAG: hypothetical protein ACP5DX_03995 [Paracoccaceae bacterium]